MLKLVSACLAIIFLSVAPAFGLAGSAPKITAAAADASAQTTPNEAEYVLGSSDVVRITIFGGDWDPGVGRERVERIRPDGMISFPLLGNNVQAAGLTANQLARKITLGLQDYMAQFRVNVSVMEFRENRVYVFGKVMKPGSYPLKSGDRLLSVLADAGGPAPRAFIGQIGIIRKKGEGLEVIKVSLENIAGKGNLANNVLLQKEDIVYVPESPFPDWDRIIDTLADISLINWTIKNW